MGHVLSDVDELHKNASVSISEAVQDKCFVDLLAKQKNRKLRELRRNDQNRAKLERIPNHKDGNKMKCSRFHGKYKGI